MELKTITKKVVSYCDIPEVVDIPDFINNAEQGSYVECHIEEGEHDDLTKWLIHTFPELEEEDSFYIHIDY